MKKGARREKKKKSSIHHRFENQAGSDNVGNRKHGSSVTYIPYRRRPHETVRGSLSTSETDGARPYKYISGRHIARAYIVSPRLFLLSVSLFFSSILVFFEVERVIAGRSSYHHHYGSCNWYDYRANDGLGHRGQKVGKKGTAIDGRNIFETSRRVVFPVFFRTFRSATPSFVAHLLDIYRSVKPGERQRSTGYAELSHCVHLCRSR